MNIDDTIYTILLLLSIPIGYLFKYMKCSKSKRLYSTVIGFLIVFIVCYKNMIHSLITILLNIFMIYTLNPKYLPLFSFIITFSYLLFFRTIHHFGLPRAEGHANAVQLLLTLKLVGLSFEIYDTHKLKLKLKSLISIINNNEDNQDNCELINKLNNEIEEIKLKLEYTCLKKKPDYIEIFSYSYCYIGILTGPYYRYRVYQDWLDFKYSSKIDSFQYIAKRGRLLPIIIIAFLLLSKFVSFQDAVNDSFYEQTTLLYRLFYMILIFTLFRFRFYIAWILAEISCMTCKFGAYPKCCKSKPGHGPIDLNELKKIDNLNKVDYCFNTVHNINEYECEFSPTVKQVLHHWNMTVQYWMANYVYKRIPIRSIGQPVTMAVSAFWHGIHPGYYLSMLTTTPCIIAESLMEKGLKRHLDKRYHKYYDICTWLFRTREFDYMSLGFILLSFNLTIKFWKSVYFIGHIISFTFIIIGFLFVKLNKKRKLKS